MDRLPIGRHVKDAFGQQSGAIAAFLKIVTALKMNQQKEIMYLIKELRINTNTWVNPI
jgi:c-di-GMP-related signal transduction protein